MPVCKVKLSPKLELLFQLAIITYPYEACQALIYLCSLFLLEKPGLHIHPQILTASPFCKVFSFCFASLCLTITISK